MTGPFPRPPRRRAVRVSSAQLVAARPLAGDDGFGLAVVPEVEQLDALAWAAGSRAWVEDRLLAAGALLFRGFDLADAHAFRAFAAALSGPLLDYTERAAPRQKVAAQVFTSTEFPAEEVIPLHHEMSYSHSWPGKLWFLCERPAPDGGATPIAGERAVTRALATDLRQRLSQRRIMYVRNYGEGVDMSWQEGFQTEQRTTVEAYCRLARMSCEWRPGDRLRTRAVRPATVAHPRTGEELWFNHAPLFHESNLPAAVRSALREQFRADEMPRNAFYGDGAPIEDDVMSAIRCVYDAHAVRFPWRRGDVLLLDNVLAVHGRDRFSGPRSILVAMAELHVDTDPEAA
jgi:alpha-ketoglutarate-dependent taurine dioxygenase